MERRTAYLSSFNNEYGKIILKDLAEFCGADKDLFASDSREHAYLEGRRSVYLHITAILSHTTEDLIAMAGGLENEDKEWTG